MIQTFKETRKRFCRRRTARKRGSLLGEESEEVLGKIDVARSKGDRGGDLSTIGRKPQSTPEESKSLDQKWEDLAWKSFRASAARKNVR